MWVSLRVPNVNSSSLSPLALILGMLLAIQTAAGQTTIYSEDFNTPGKDTRYLLSRDYFEPSQPNNLWTTVPNQLPGDNVIVYLEPGDEYFDGSPVPARRATFFGDNDLGDQTPLIDLTEDGFALFDAAVNWASDTDGTTPLQVNFVIDDDTPFESNNLDLTLIDRLIEQGHEIIVTHADEPPSDDDDLIFMASHDNGSAVGSLAPEFKTTTVPLISGFFHAAGPLGFGSERGENTNGTFDLQIVDAAHPLAAGFSQGLVQAVDDAAARQRFTRVTRGQIAPDAKVVATLPGSVISTPDDFTNFEGEGYLRGGHSTWNNAPEAGEPRGWQTIEPLDTTIVENPQLVVALAAGGGDELAFGPYEDAVVAPEDFDFIRLLFDDNGDGEFETLTEFAAREELDTDFPGSLLSEEGTPLTMEFQEFTFDLPSSSMLDLRIDVFTNAGDERVGIDGIRVIGEGRAIEGDCNGDNVLDASDLDCATPDTIAVTLESLNLIAGDLNASGTVDFDDFVILSANFNKPDQVYSAGDINVDGAVDFDDFVALSTNFNLSSGTVAAVPEPSSRIALVLAFIVCARTRDRRRRGWTPHSRRSLRRSRRLITRKAEATLSLAPLGIDLCYYRRSDRRLGRPATRAIGDYGDRRLWGSATRATVRPSAISLGRSTRLGRDCHWVECPRGQRWHHRLSRPVHCDDAGYWGFRSPDITPGSPGRRLLEIAH